MHSAHYRMLHGHSDPHSAFRSAIPNIYRMIDLIVMCVTSCVGAISGQSKTVISPKRIIGKWRDRFHFKLYFSEHQVFNFQRPSIWFSLRNPPIKQIACRTNLLAELCLLLFSWWKNELRYKNQTSPVGYAIPFSMSRLTFVILFRLHGRYGDRI